MPEREEITVFQTLKEQEHRTSIPPTMESEEFKPCATMSNLSTVVARPRGPVSNGLLFLRFCVTTDCQRCLICRAAAASQLAYVPMSESVNPFGPVGASSSTYRYGYADRTISILVTTANLDEGMLIRSPLILVALWYVPWECVTRGFLWPRTRNPSPL